MLNFYVYKFYKRYFTHCFLCGDVIMLSKVILKKCKKDIKIVKNML